MFLLIESIKINKNLTQVDVELNKTAYKKKFRIGKGWNDSEDQNLIDQFIENEGLKYSVFQRNWWKWGKDWINQGLCGEDEVTMWKVVEGKDR